MYTSDIDTQKTKLAKTSFGYLLVSLFCALFGAVYEYYSHEVYSNFMIYAFAFPLAGGAIPCMALSLYERDCLPGKTALFLYHAGIAALTVGSMMKGVLEIYGTTNDLLQVYWFAGFGLWGAGLLLYAKGVFFDGKNRAGKRAE